MLRPGELEIAANAPPAGCSPETAQQFTKWLATHHYENFSVVSWLLPKELHQHFYNVYAYCRWADDLGDEIPDASRALELLDWWDRELDLCYEGKPSHPIFIALRQTILEKDIPKQPFADLLTAFRQNQTVMRYHTFEDVIGYCKYSANPVGHLVLYLGGYKDAERQRFSDLTCTALQFTNSWQDVAQDFEKGRVYLPQEDLRRFGVSEAVIASKKATPEFRELMRFEVERAWEWFRQGLPLIGQVRREVARDVELFSRGGMEILNAIEASGYDVLSRRPTLSKGRKLVLGGRALWSRLV
jgi:squalene synthase HpnC